MKMQFYGDTVNEVIGKALVDYGKDRHNDKTSAKNPYGGKTSQSADKVACTGIVRNVGLSVGPLGPRVGLLDGEFRRIEDELGAERRNDSNFLAVRQKYSDLTQAIREVQTNTAGLTRSTNLRHDIQAARQNLNMRQTIDMLRRALERLDYRQSPTGMQFNLRGLEDDLRRMDTQFQNAERQLQSLGCLDQ